MAWGCSVDRGGNANENGGTAGSSTGGKSTNAGGSSGGSAARGGGNSTAGGSINGGSPGSTSGGTVGAAGEGIGGELGAGSGGEGASALGGNTSSGGTAGSNSGGSTLGGSSDGGKLGAGGANSGGAGGGTVTGGGASSGGKASGGTGNGGTVTSGGASSGGKANGGTGSGGAPGAGGSCSSGTSACTSGCVDLTTSKTNCGACGVVCEGYQFCAASKCLPKYESTRVQPTTTGGGAPTVTSAGVFTNKAQGDLLIQLTGDLTLSTPGASMTATLQGAGYVRYTAAGVMVWSRTSKQIFSDNAQTPETPMALMSNGDFAVVYPKYDPPTGPVAGTTAFRLARVAGTNGGLLWEAKYPQTASRPDVVIPRTAKGDYLTLSYCLTYSALGDAMQVVDSGTTRTVTRLGTSYAMGASPSADGTTAWIWGQFAGPATVPLNPLSSQAWPVVPNGGQAGGDLYLLGAQDGATTGPWFSEGDTGVTLPGMAVDSAGDIVFAARAGGYTAFNGDQEFFTAVGESKLLAKVSRTTGKILWKTLIPASADVRRLVVGPADRVIVFYATGDTAAPYKISIYSGSDGALLSSINAAPDSYAVLAAGLSDLFVIGSVASPFDFNPGTAVDSLGSTPGLYISRFSF